jgi:HD-GYP domain-containing protein (c-di-GMP phosphodiesterase class II)
MSSNFRKDLEKAARQMILVRRVDVLSRLILRTIMRNVKVKHAGILLLDQAKQEYIMKVSKGEKGIKVPEDFTKIGLNNPMIRYFTSPEFKCFKQDSIDYNRCGYYLKSRKVRADGNHEDFFKQLISELSLYQAKMIIPGFYRNNLIGLLLLGGKQNGKAFRAEELGFFSVLASDVVMAIQNAWLFEDLNAQLTINKKLFLNTVTALAAAIEAKDKYTSGHTERVVNYSVEIAKNLRNGKADGSEEFEKDLRIAAMLHDIGKIGVPEKVLNKKTALSQLERESITRHPLMGIEILDPIKEFKDVMLAVKYHHERYDGKGYPFRLLGEEIPIIASIVSVADAFDAMTSDRPYRKAFTKEHAIKEIKNNSGKQFHPKVVDAFLKAFDIESRSKSHKARLSRHNGYHASGFQIGKNA